MAQPRRSHARVLTPTGFSVLAVIVFISALMVTWAMLSLEHRAHAAPGVQARR